MIALLVLLTSLAMAATPPRVDPRYGNIAIPFEPNQGQAPADIRFLSSIGACGLAIHDDGATIAVSSSHGARESRMRLVGAVAPRQVRGLEKLPGISSYFNGPDESKWLRNIPQYKQVRLEHVYKGVDLVFYGAGATIEYDFVIAPWMDSRAIAYRFGGVSEPTLDANGDLLVDEVRHHRPVAYQNIGGKRKAVEARFALDDGVVRFVVGQYDRSKELVIDPSIAYSYFFDGQGGSSGRGVAVDSTGAAYFTGLMQSGFNSGNQIIKINAAGTLVSYVAYIGIGNPNAIAVDANGFAYIAGTSGPGLPTKNPLNVFASGTHAFVAKFNADGSDLVYSTYLGGSGFDDARKVAVDPTGAAYVVGNTTSADLPIVNAAQATLRGGSDSFLMKLNPQGSQLLLSTYFGGSGPELLTGLALDSNGNILITGSTDGVNLGLTRPISTNGSSFLVRFLPNGIIDVATLLPLTITSGVAVDAHGNAYVGGYPNTAFLPGQAAGAILARVNFTTPGFQVLISMPGTPSVLINAITIDNNGAIYVTGAGNTHLPLLRSIQPLRGQQNSAFVLKAASDGSLIYSTILGSNSSANDLTTDTQGRVYVVGTAAFGDFPGVNSISPTPRSTSGAFLLRITDTPDLQLVKVTVGIDVGAPIVGGQVGIIVSVDGTQFTDSTVFYWPAGENHTVTVSTLFKQGTGVRYTFQNWNDGGNQTHVVAPTQDSQILAKFYTEILVTTTVSGPGTVSMTPPSPTNDGYYPLGTKVTFTAQPAPGQFFLGWGGVLKSANSVRSLVVSYPGAISVGPLAATAAFGSVPPPVYSFALGYVPITPCRVMDTRPGEGKTGAFGPPFLAGGSTRTITVSDGTCNIPPAAKAFALNATVVPLRPLAFLTIYPAGQTRPNVSTLNAFEGQVVANNTIVPIGASNGISVFATDDTHVVLDINGYFIDTEESLTFYPLAPCRVLDTRTGSAPAVIDGGATRTFSIPSSCLGSSGANAQAVALNFTVVPRGSLDYITAWPAGSTRPLASTLNSMQGRTLANSAIIPLGANREISVYASQATDLVVDINGFFGPAPATNPGFAPAAYRFYATPPCRFADTRTASTQWPGNGPPMLQANATRNFGTGSCVSLVGPIGGLSVNATVVPPGPLPYLTLFNGFTVPLASTLNAANGQIVANGTIVAGPFIGAFAPAATDLILDLNGYFAP